MFKISTFDDWIDYFRQWQKDIGYDPALLGDYNFETKLGELHTPEIEFGDFKGQAKWQRVSQIPNQSIRDALLNLIVYQGDTEFASVEQQKNLLDTAPTEYDRQALTRVNSEEMRHGWSIISATPANWRPESFWNAALSEGIDCSARSTRQ